MSPEELLVETVRDLQDRLAEGSEYAMLKASGLLRLLFLDEHPLAPLVARLNGRYKLSFEVPDAPPVVPQMHALTIMGISGGRFSKSVPLASFLSFTLYAWDEDGFTVRDIIDICANSRGGVHFDSRPRLKRPALQRFSEWGPKFGITQSKLLDSATGSIFQIAHVALRALEPLITVVLDSRPELRVSWTRKRGPSDLFYIGHELLRKIDAAELLAPTGKIEISLRPRMIQRSGTQHFSLSSQANVFQLFSVDDWLVFRRNDSAVSLQLKDAEGEALVVAHWDTSSIHLRLGSARPFQFESSQPTAKHLWPAEFFLAALAEQFIEVDRLDDRAMWMKASEAFSGASHLVGFLGAHPEFWRVTFPASQRGVREPKPLIEILHLVRAVLSEALRANRVGAIRRSTDRFGDFDVVTNSADSDAPKALLSVFSAHEPGLENQLELLRVRMHGHGIAHAIFCVWSFGKEFPPLLAGGEPAATYLTNLAKNLLSSEQVSIVELDLAIPDFDPRAA